MPAPAKEVPPNELFLKLLERPRPSEEVPFQGLDQPGAKGKLRCQVLAKEDNDRARLTAFQSLKKNAGRYGITSLTEADLRDEAIRGVVSDLAACEVIAMAYTTTTPTPGFTEDDPLCKYDRVFPDGEAVGKTLTADEVRYLFSAYQLVQAKYGPNEAVCLPEDINLWVRRLVEGAADFPFLRLDSHQWAELLTMMAGQLYKLSDLLTSQWESLPESLRSDLQTYCLDTTSSGEPVGSLSASGQPQLPEGEISFEQAVRFANQQLGRGEPNE
jgi:hypothetical protein